MDARYARNSDAFNQYGHWRKDTFTRKVPIQRNNKPSPTEEDSKNRKNIVIEMSKIVEKGNTPETSAAMLAADEKVKRNFEYLIKNGLELEKVFVGWYNGKQRTKEEVEICPTR